MKSKIKPKAYVPTGTSATFVIASETEKLFGLEVIPDNDGVYLRETGGTNEVGIYKKELKELIAVLTMIADGKAEELSHLRKSSDRHPN